MGRGALLAYNFFIVGFILTGNVISAYENIALNKPAWQQSPYDYNLNWGADKAVDGRFTDRESNGGQCTISAEGFYTAYWWVDLGRVLSIHHINIFYRTANDSSNGYTARFLGFSVYVSNTPNKDDGFLCFKDTTFTRDTIPENFTTECVMHGRYVIYYNERGGSINRPGFSQYAFNELCEVQVLECNNGKFGQNCTQSCGVCLDKEQCHHINGSCVNGCDRGYQGINCTQACPEGRFDYNCRQKCSINCRIAEKCNIITGQCNRGCLTGWRGERCDKLIDISLNPDQSSPWRSYLYGVLAILCLSLILNIFLIFRSYRNKRNKRKNYKEKNTKDNSQEKTPNTEIYDKVEDNGGYQELGHLSQPSHYDKLQ